jgi:ribonuclease HII
VRKVMGSSEHINPAAAPAFRLPRLIVRRDTGISAYEAALGRAGFTTVAGADEAGRGACAGPLVVAACVLAGGARGRIDGLNDSKLLTAATRERLYAQIVKRAAVYAIVVVPAAEIDAYGLHVANLAGMRRAIGQLSPAPTYALTDGFPVRGLAVPTTSVWKGDATVGCIAAASILAKVTRDAIMTEYHEQWPEYDFARHKGYVTAAHSAALTEHGPCPQHRRRYVNVRRALGVAQLADIDEYSIDDPDFDSVGDNGVDTAESAAMTMETV